MTELYAKIRNMKMKQEFNLSEKERLFLKNQFWKKEEDVKEFIRILLIADKEGLNMTEVIKHHAGEELID